MKLKRLVQVLVLGGVGLVAACGGSDGSTPPPGGSSVPPPHSRLPDGGIPPPGYGGPTIW